MQNGYPGSLSSRWSSMKISPPVVSKAVKASFGKFDHFRKARKRFMTQLVSRWYQKERQKDDSDSRASPLNMLHTAVTTLVPNLVFNDPRVKIRSDIMIYSQYAEMLELATNHLVRRIKLRDTLRKAIFDAIFMAGFIKSGIAAGDQYLPIGDANIELGQPFADRVDPDDIILDPWARDWNEQAFIGNRFRADLDDLQELGLYDADELERLSREYQDPKNDRVSRLSGNIDNEYSEIRRYVDLCEVWFRKENVVVTLPYDRGGKGEQFLRIAEYMGPDTGPYHMLGFTPVSDNILPVAPAMIWYDLHQMGNRIARKLARQAERLKSVLAYEEDAAEDAEEIADADDGETVRVKDVGKIKEVKYGGATPEAYQWMEWVKRNFSEQANSLDLLSGVGSDQPTLGQAEILQANTSVRLGDMQGITYDFTGGVCRDLGYQLHNDPLIDLPLIRRVRGVEQQVFYTPEIRKGDAFDFTYKVQPYSMAKPDPNRSLRHKMEFATNVIPAAAQNAMLLGPGFKVGPFLKSIANEVQLDDYEEWLDDAVINDYIAQKVQMAMMMGDPGKAGGGAMPAQGVPGTFNPAQPVPGAMGPQGGISPETEGAMMQQESSAVTQSGRASVKQLAAGM